MTVPSTFKFLLKRNDKVCKFDTNLHKWVELCDYSALTTTNFTSNGLTYAHLTTSYTTKFLAYTETETLSDGSKVYESETITAYVDPMTGEKKPVPTEIEPLTNIDLDTSGFDNLLNLPRI